MKLNSSFLYRKSKSPRTLEILLRFDWDDIEILFKFYESTSLKRNNHRIAFKFISKCLFSDKFSNNCSDEDT